MPERIIHPQPAEGTKAADFFESKIVVVSVTKEEFIKVVKNKYPEKKSEDIEQTKGINFEHNGQIIVLLRTDIFPEQYMPYFEIHEKWEAYIARKPGYNLFQKSVREYQREKQADLHQDSDLQDFYRDIGVYNYEFRHELAVYKEYQQAMLDGKLDEYHHWFMNLREKEKQKADAKNLKLIANDTEIRESIYRKLKDNSKHHFLRK